MDDIEVVAALAALAQPSRLATFRLLVAAEPRGMAAGDVARRLAMPQNTLSAHLAVLTRAGLTRFERHGRNIVYRADIDRLSDVLRFLGDTCCGGQPEICAPRLPLQRSRDRRETAKVAAKVYNVLFLCAGNTAVSILAEGILRKEGQGRFNAFSAGSTPKGVVNPLSIEVLAAHGCPTDGYRSKSWDEYAVPGAPTMDFIFTVRDFGAGEACPIWPGHPRTAHWGVDDPAAVEGTHVEKLRAFEQAFRSMRNRIVTFAALPLASLDCMTLAARLRDIGRMDGASTAEVGS